MKFHIPPVSWTSLMVERLRRITAVSLVVLLLPLAPLDLLAQQSGPYYGQYPAPQAPYRQQPYYAQPQAYAPQPSYPAYGSGQAQPQGYNQQPYYPQQQSQAYGQQGYAPQQQSQAGYGQNSMQAQPLSPQQLDQLVAPLALYPDPLVAQVLTASTYPAQVSEADRWRQAQGYTPAEQMAAAVDAQNWDPSIKALTAFPQLLAQMDRNLRWTTDLGNAYYNQPEDILQAVQQMRQRAQAAGNLQSNGQQTVSYDQGNIEVAPANPQVVYVPAYNPWAVYGPGLSPYPGFLLLGALGSFLGSTVQFGLGIGVGVFSRLAFGWMGWGLSWLSHAVLFHNAYYFSHSNSVADWGFAHGGRRAFGGNFNRQAGGYSNGFNRSAQGYGGGRPMQQAYNRVSYGGGGYRAGGTAFARNDFAQRPSGAFGGQHFAGVSAKGSSSGGFHSFGGGHAAKGFGGGGHSGGHFGGGHSGGGHSGGGGHWFGKHH